jgi:hypothetical protein
LSLSLGYLSASLAQASPFDDAFDDFDKEGIGQEQRRDDQRALCCLAPIEDGKLDPIRSKLRQKSGDANSELRAQLTLYFLDAQTGEGIRGASVSFKGATGRTDRIGRVCFHYPSGELMDSTLKAHFERSGYMSFDAELKFMAGALFFNRFSVSKALPAGKLRVVLDWDQRPRDLDAHLVREGMYHISFRQTRSYQDQALLDRDDMDGFGPETITVQRLDPSGEYRYFVHDYTRSGALSQSKAHVHVYSERGLEKSFRVPSDLKGDKWEVFKLARGQLLNVK